MCWRTSLRVSPFLDGFVWFILFGCLFLLWRRDYMYGYTLGHVCVYERKSKGFREFKNMPDSQIFHKYSFTLEFNLLIYTF